MEEAKNEIVVFQPDETMRLEVAVHNETVWLSQRQMCDLFGRERSVITKHIKNVFDEGELIETNNVQILHNNQRGKPLSLYSLDVIISVGYRVKSLRGTQFRQWATSVLREYLIRGVVVKNQQSALASEMDRRLAYHETRIAEVERKVDFVVRSALPAPEMVFVEGKMLDAQIELTRIVKMARKRIVLIDNYIDERTLMLLGNRQENVECTIYTLRPNSPKLAPALANYAREYPTLPIEVKGYVKSHDRFLVIDDTVWHIGASLKDAGSALFAMMKMELNPEVILTLLS